MREVEPIRETKQIATMRAVLKSSKRGLRDDALFVLGINTALRVGDLLALTVGDALGPNRKIKDALQLTEKKTNKQKKCPINKAAKEALAAYLGVRFGQAADPAAVRDAPLFASGKTGKGERPISRQHAHHVLAEAAAAIGLKSIGAHSLRKTFGYHVFKKTGGNLALVQKLLNHESPAVTLRYIGITREDMDNAVIELNLG